jgi:hypothetical protein
MDESMSEDHEMKEFRKLLSESIKRLEDRVEVRIAEYQTRMNGDFARINTKLTLLENELNK